MSKVLHKRFAVKKKCVIFLKKSFNKCIINHCYFKKFILLYNSTIFLSQLLQAKPNFYFDGF